MFSSVYSGYIVIKNHGHFSQEVDLHVHKNDELLSFWYI